MNTPFTFSKTVIGYSHIRKGTPTEDASAHFSDPQGRYHIAVISDGHGDKNCFRSSFGSVAVVESTMKNLKIFAEGLLYDRERYENFVADKTIQQRYISVLTNAIFATWHKLIEQDLKDNPPTEDDYAQCAPNVADMYRAGARTAHIYGATLIAAIKVLDCLVLLQQGDGRCDVFYADGSVNQPIPWDSRCHENVTTSMCDVDAPISIRHRVIDTLSEKVIACYVGSDGVEDSFPNNDDVEQLGTHQFYKDLTCQIIDRYQNEADLYSFLDAHFSNLSKTGSADDVSVSGIVFTDECKAFYTRFKNEVSAYDIDFRIADIDAKIAGVQRKHTILKKRMDDAKANYDSALAREIQRSKDLDSLKADLTRLTKTREDLEIEYLRSKTDADEVKTNNDVLSMANMFLEKFRSFIQEIAAAVALAKRNLDAAKAKEDKKKLEIEKFEKDLETFRNNIEVLKKTYEDAKAEFEAFDEICRGYVRQRNELLAQKQALLHPNAPSAAADPAFTDAANFDGDASASDNAGDSADGTQIPSYFTDNTVAYQIDPLTPPDLIIPEPPVPPAAPIISKVVISSASTDDTDSDESQGS